MIVRKTDLGDWAVVWGNYEEVILDFATLTQLKEEVDREISMETSCMLQEELFGDYTCEGCTI